MSFYKIITMYLNQCKLHRAGASDIGSCLQEWVDKAVSATPAVEEDGKKRKRDETETEAETGMKAVKTADVNGNTPGNKTTKAKLSSFSFGKN